MLYLIDYPNNKEIIIAIIHLIIRVLIFLDLYGLNLIIITKYICKTIKSKQVLTTN